MLNNAVPLYRGGGGLTSLHVDWIGESRVIKWSYVANTPGRVGSGRSAPVTGHARGSRKQLLLEYFHCSARPGEAGASSACVRLYAEFHGSHGTQHIPSYVLRDRTRSGFL